MPADVLAILLVRVRTAFPVPPKGALVRSTLNVPFIGMSPVVVLNVYSNIRIDPKSTTGLYAGPEGLVVDAEGPAVPDNGIGLVKPCKHPDTAIVTTTIKVNARPIRQSFMHPGNMEVWFVACDLKHCGGLPDNLYRA